MEVNNLLDTVKAACGIPSQVTIYDDSISQLVQSCVDDMTSAGVPDTMTTIASDLSTALTSGEAVTINPRVLTAIKFYVRANWTLDDTSDATWYRDQYRRVLHKLMVEPEEGDV